MVSAQELKWRVERKKFSLEERANRDKLFAGEGTGMSKRKET